MISGKVRAHVLISGRVQGVAFRYYAEKWAISQGVTGWIRNLPDGRVEVLAEGDTEAIDRFLGQLKNGPRMARVDVFEEKRTEATGEFPDFRVTFP
jgi:acylphosphatase